MVVGKKQSETALRHFLDAGHRLFGENRVQEAWDKWPYLKYDFQDVRLHLIGPLQTNKVGYAYGLFDCIETVDRPKLVEKIADYLPRAERYLDLFVQINIGREPQKSGVLPEDLPALMDLCVKRGVPITGFMCIPPVGVDPTPYFQQMAMYQREYGVKHLSMGMSGDYEKAIECGATIVRIGSLLFGIGS